MAKQEGRGSTNRENSSFLFFFFSLFVIWCFLFWGRAQHYRDHVIHLEYANSWQCICLLVLDLPLGGRSPTQLRSLSAVCLQTPVILPHSATLRQSHFSTSHPLCVCLEAVGFAWGRLVLGFWEGVDGKDKWWGSWECIISHCFITPVSKLSLLRQFRLRSFQ